MRKRNKKEKIEPKYDFEVVNITSAIELPVRYMVVTEDWQSCMERWKEKLGERGLYIVEPVVVYSLERKVGGKELCIEIKKREG